MHPVLYHTGFRHKWRYIFQLFVLYEKQQKNIWITSLNIYKAYSIIVQTVLSLVNFLKIIKLKFLKNVIFSKKKNIFNSYSSKAFMFYNEYDIQANESVDIDIRPEIESVD